MSERTNRPAYVSGGPTGPTGPIPVLVVSQPTPAPVEIWPSTGKTVLTVLAVCLGVLHALALLVFLYAMYSLQQALQHLSDGLNQLGNVWGN